MRNTLVNLSRSLAFLTLIAIMSIGCSKPPTKGIITVVDLETGIAVSGAEVKLFMEQDNQGFFPCDEGFVREKIYFTGAGGVVDICFEHASVINVLVTTNSLLGNEVQTGSGRLSLQAEETTGLTIRVTE